MNKLLISKNNFLFFIFTLSTVFLSHAAHAIEASQQQAIDTAVKEALKNATNETDAAGGTNDQAIMSKYFGAGIMANFDFTRGGTRVKSARVVGGVVRVEESSLAQVGFMLEAHKFTSSPPSAGARYVYGPFIGLVMQDASIDTAILGWMWGFRQPQSTQTLNLGIGLSVSPRAQVLGDGITEGAPLPNGETEVRFKHVTKYGFSIITSFGF